ncbi:UDP-N-acetylglucosamine 1-carboxyvinyltransferase [Candidatus Formimonas warabiya]|uniref:UDP-N-acetylglucosamine 1-carboxyvinyltransferase n=1 Tax=Formimonas warabiya TaxID=1761012 RepID=A0A3G1KRG2_FORW1|nr:UDP-N-acetylglucosamine 1-carboxyvinyltransferase [Candidatus Formimonas warabiya]ATW25054.1 UDP-N-acetylglucosamine 1-carboxyvinyltransferase [Candidatus Formimonas warabiya]
MERYIITGGTRLHGLVEVCGAKNAVLPILAATLLSAETCVIHNVPQLQDVVLLVEILEYLGAKIKWEKKTLIVNASNINPTEVPEETMKKMRASNLVLGPLLSRFHSARAPFPGGCAIGSRPMDYHIKGLEQLGASIIEKYGNIEAYAHKLTGDTVYLDFPSVGATENIMMAATLAEGVTMIRNAAREPEIVDLALFLKSMGAKIEGAGSDNIQITGVAKLHGADHTVIPDRIVAGTYMLAAAITNGDLVLRNAVAEHVEPLTVKLRASGVIVSKNGKGLRVRGVPRVKSVDLKTMPYPGFPTDIQPQMMALMTVAQGTSVILENIFENRFKHADELRRMGANIIVEGRVAVVKGVKRLTGAMVEATDLRAGAALVLAGMAAEGITVIENIGHIDRGYHRLEQKYALLGARIVREKMPREEEQEIKQDGLSRDQQEKFPLISHKEMELNYKI